MKGDEQLARTRSAASTTWPKPYNSIQLLRVIAGSYRRCHCCWIR